MNVVNTFPSPDGFSYSWFCLVYFLAINFLTLAAVPAFSTECSVVMCLRSGAQILCGTSAALHSQLLPAFSCQHVLSLHSVSLWLTMNLRKKIVSHTIDNRKFQPQSLLT